MRVLALAALVAALVPAAAHADGVPSDRAAGIPQTCCPAGRVPPPARILGFFDGN